MFWGSPKPNPPIAPNFHATLSFASAGESLSASEPRSKVQPVAGSSIQPPLGVHVSHVPHVTAVPAGADLFQVPFGAVKSVGFDESRYAISIETTGDPLVILDNENWNPSCATFRPGTTPRVTFAAVSWDEVGDGLQTVQRRDRRLVRAQGVKTP